LIRRAANQIENELHDFASRKHRASFLDTSERHRGNSGLDRAHAG
jgi:hypothetical protein